MSLTNYPYGLSSFGIPLLGAQGLMTQGKAFFVDPTGGSDSHSGDSITDAFASLDAAHDAMTANQNDTCYYLAGASGMTLAEKLTWSKNMCHLVGIAAPVPWGSRARIFQLSTATGVSPLIDVTASGCIFDNLYIFHGVNDATSKVCVRVTGGRNYFRNVHFAGIGHATMDVSGAASLELNGSEECMFERCTIGLDTQGTRGANSTELLFTAGGAAHRNFFLDCLFTAYISAAGHRLVTIGDGTAIDRLNIFKNCLFVTDSINRGVTATETFSTPAGIVQGKIILLNCANLTDGASGAGVWDASGANVIWANMGAPTAAAAGGLMTKL